jgi:hypothetical protein
MATKKMTMGLIVGNRGFFPDHLAKSGREEMMRVLTAAGMDVVALTPEESKHGAVETREESRRCADLFKRNRDRIDGVIVTLPNFGEERAIADALRLADLRVPVLDPPPRRSPEDDHRLPSRQLAARCRPVIICASMVLTYPSQRCTPKARFTELAETRSGSPEFARVATGFRDHAWELIGRVPRLSTRSGTAKNSRIRALIETPTSEVRGPHRGA